eukprot:CAMPEP_0178426110 /NCGR_PEP_ID=MMETSP0689_2-20121128/29067_1 /TAXON_ID=160604 /ORGANISM="Amphidinium massartii, Strain CS-259" /LENGTH=325 /DNA_ID=CAMNT_0020047789 /DNA_START=138 /DNA_END=1115 /DNA_ORIENTATION=+
MVAFATSLSASCAGEECDASVDLLQRELVSTRGAVVNEDWQSEELLAEKPWNPDFLADHMPIRCPAAESIIPLPSGRAGLWIAENHGNHILRIALPPDESNFIVFERNLPYYRPSPHMYMVVMNKTFNTINDTFNTMSGDGIVGPEGVTFQEAVQELLASPLSNLIIEASLFMGVRGVTSASHPCFVSLHLVAKVISQYSLVKDQAGISGFLANLSSSSSGVSYTRQAGTSCTSCRRRSPTLSGAYGVVRADNQCVGACGPECNHWSFMCPGSSGCNRGCEMMDYYCASAQTSSNGWWECLGAYPLDAESLTSFCGECSAENLEI